MNVTRKKALVVLAAFWCVLFCAYNPFSKEAIASLDLERHVPFAGTGRAYETGPLPAGSVIEQFVTAPEKIEQFDIRFGTYLKRTDARIRISVCPADGVSSALEHVGGYTVPQHGRLIPG